MDISPSTSTLRSGEDIEGYIEQLAAISLAPTNVGFVDLPRELRDMISNYLPDISIIALKLS